MSTQVQVHVHVRQHVHGISYHVHVAKVRGPQFNPGWLPGFHSSLKAFPHVHVQTNCGIPTTRLHAHSSGRDDCTTLILSQYTTYKIDTQYCHAVHNEHAQKDDIQVHT